MMMLRLSVYRKRLLENNMKVYVLSNADGQGGSPDIPVDVQQSPHF